MNLCDAIVIGGGQSGLAAAHALRTQGLRPVVLEAGAEPVGSWPHYYDSLTLFSPARFSAFPDVPFPGDPDHYPHRDDVVDYLRRYARTLDADIRTHHRVSTVTADNGTYTVHTEHGEALQTNILIAATGGFSRPHRPELPGLNKFAGTVLHASDYRNPAPFAGQRVLVVGAGNSAVQIAVELAEHAHTTITSRTPPRYADPTLLGRDLHWWTATTRLDILPLGPWLRTIPTTPVSDKGTYKAAIEARKPDHRALFDHLNTTEVTWTDGTREHIDAVILATGYRPDLTYLQPLGALDPTGAPHHRRGLSRTCPGLGYVGLEWQTSFSSATLRGVHRDAHHVAGNLAKAAGKTGMPVARPRPPTDTHAIYPATRARPSQKRRRSSGTAPASGRAATPVPTRDQLRPCTSPAAPICPGYVSQTHVHRDWRDNRQWTCFSLRR